MNLFRSNKARIFLTVFLIYLFYIAPDYLNANTNRSIDLAKAIVDDRTFIIDKYHKNTIDVSFYKGHYYIGAAPGLGLMAVPVYAILRPFFSFIPQDIYNNLELNILNIFFTIFLSVLPGALIAVLLYDLLQAFNVKEKERMLTVFASSFGTILFFYSTRFMSHTMEAFILLSAFYILFKAQKLPTARLLFFICGICLGLAVLLDYLLIVASSILLVYSFLNFKKGDLQKYIFLMSGLALTAFIFMYYHYRCFGGPFTGAFTYGIEYGYKLGLHPPGLKVMYEFSFGIYRGLFVYMPILLISVYGVYKFFRHPEKKFIKEMVLIMLISLSTFFIMSGYEGWYAGDAFGPRYFVCFLPFLMIPIIFAYKNISYNVVLWVAGISIMLNWCGVQYSDTENAFIHVGRFILRGLNSGLAEWTYKLTNIYIRKLNVISHFSPLIGFIILLTFIYLIWKEELEGLVCRRKS